MLILSSCWQVLSLFEQFGQHDIVVAIATRVLNEGLLNEGLDEFKVQEFAYTLSYMYF